MARTIVVTRDWARFILLKKGVDLNLKVSEEGHAWITPETLGGFVPLPSRNGTAGPKLYTGPSIIERLLPHLRKSWTEACDRWLFEKQFLTDLGLPTDEDNLQKLIETYWPEFHSQGKVEIFEM